MVLGLGTWYGVALWQWNISCKLSISVCFTKSHMTNCVVYEDNGHSSVFPSPRSFSRYPEAMPVTDYELVLLGQLFWPLSYFLLFNGRSNWNFMFCCRFLKLTHVYCPVILHILSTCGINISKCLVIWNPAQTVKFIDET